MSGAQMAAGAAHDPANRDYTQIVFAENIIAVIRSPSFYAASRRPVPSEGERIPTLPLFHARFAGRHRGGNLVDAPGLEPGTSCM